MTWKEKRRLLNVDKLNKKRGQIGISAFMPNPRLEAELKAKANAEMSSQSDTDEEIKEDRRREDEKEVAIATKFGTDDEASRHSA